MSKLPARALTNPTTVAQGIELVTMVGATAAEAMRARRDPAVQAAKKRRAAKRRLTAWTGGAVLSAAVTATGAADVVQGGAGAGAIGALVFVTALLIWCIVGMVRAAIDLRARSRVLAALPAAAPARPAVAAEIRPELSRLDGYSDGLRHLVGMIGIVDDDAGVRALRDEILSAADASEARLRQQAVDLTGLLRARRTAPADAARQLDATAKLLRRQITDGVAGYGELVSAASDAVAASRMLADQTGRPGAAVARPGGPAVAGGSLHPELEQPIDQLRALAAGMRELTQD